VLQLVIENAAALALLVGAITSAITSVRGLVKAVAYAIVKVAPLFSGKVNHRARRLERAKRAKR
jgi:hypothetical protein